MVFSRSLSTLTTYHLSRGVQSHLSGTELHQSLERKKYIDHATEINLTAIRTADDLNIFNSLVCNVTVSV